MRRVTRRRGCEGRDEVADWALHMEKAPVFVSENARDVVAGPLSGDRKSVV